MRPKLIGAYRVLETLGSGGVGTVYRARDARTNELVAVKVLTGAPGMDARAAKRLVREFETLVNISHPHVVRVFDAGVYQASPYLVMELVEGLTLRDYLSLSGPSMHTSGASSRRWEDSWGGGSSEDPASEEDSEEGLTPFGLSAFNEESPSEEESELPWKEEAGDEAEQEEQARREAMARMDELNRPERLGRLKDAMLQVCEALAYIHGHGLVHRDLKPSNIMVDEDRLVRLMDFGLAKFLADDAAVTGGRMVGTFRYMAPEQILGEPLDARADLYSLGVVLYELLTGRPPFDARTPQELWQQVLEVEPQPLRWLNTRGDPQLAMVAHRLMKKEPDDRFQTAEEVYEALSE